MIHDISALVLPEDHPARREPLPGTKVLQDSFWDHYDSRTLIYDCVHDTRTRQLHLYAPPALNLMPLFEAATFELDGRPLGPFRHHRSIHHDRFTFTGVRQARTLRCRIADMDEVLVVNPVDDGLRDLNVLYTMMKNEKLTWLRDWATFHVRMHGAQALVLCDNGSDAYTTPEVEAALKDVPGLDQVRIVSVPLRHGPKARHCTGWSGQKFLQAAMLNVMRHRLCARSGPMLCLDTDELCVGLDRESVFGATRRSLFGYIAFNGTWRYATPTDGIVRHRHHTLADSTDIPCYTKYCVRPDSIIGRYAPLQVHNVHFGPRKRFIRNDRFTYLHCRNISTSWNDDRQSQDTEGLIHDPFAADVLARAFPEAVP